jgi:hypothetical protein
MFYVYGLPYQTTYSLDAKKMVGKSLMLIPYAYCHLLFLLLILQQYQEPGGQWSFSAILSRVNKKSSDRESVTLRPREKYLCPTALEARHWGATYALYRVGLVLAIYTDL